MYNTETCIKLVMKLSEKYPDILAELLKESESKSESESESDTESESESDTESESESETESESESDTESESESDTESVRTNMTQDSVLSVDYYSLDHNFEDESTIGYESIHSEESESEKSKKQFNNRCCGLCKEVGHYRNNCPTKIHLPMKKTSTWNAMHKQYIRRRYKCVCGKEEINKGNLTRHQRNNGCLNLN